MRIALVEDDSDQAADIKDALTKAFGAVEVEAISTEAAYRAALDRWTRTPPDVLIIDAMIESSMDDEPEAVNADEVLHKAGFRFEFLLRSGGALMPAIIYSVLDRTTLDQSLSLMSPLSHYVMKEYGFEGLIETIRRVTARQ